MREIPLFGGDFSERLDISCLLSEVRSCVGGALVIKPDDASKIYKVRHKGVGESSASLFYNLVNPDDSSADTTPLDGFSMVVPVKLKVVLKPSDFALLINPVVEGAKSGT